MCVVEFIKKVYNKIILDVGEDAANLNNTNTRAIGNLIAGNISGS